MSDADMLTRYIQKARAVGVEVELMASHEFPGRLAVFLLEHKEETSPLLALSTSGWPVGLLGVVRSTVASSGFRIVSPQPTPEDREYFWNQEELATASLGITFCEAFLAETGSLVLAAGPGRGTLASLLPEVHLALSTAEGCCENLADHLASLAGMLPSRLTLITGPSRTGDIEATMTTGVHGPGRVLHWIFADQKDHM